MPNLCTISAESLRSVAQLLASAFAAGIEVEVRTDTIRVKGPNDAKALAELIVGMKAEVIGAFGQWSDEAALALMHHTDGAFEGLGASGRTEPIRSAVDAVYAAHNTRNMPALIAACRELLRRARTAARAA